MSAHGRAAPTTSTVAAAGEPQEAWQEVLRDAVRDVRELATLLGLPADQVARRLDVAPEFPVLVPRGFVARMRRGDLDDPLLKQVLPLAEENVDRAGYEPDPLREHGLGEGGLIRKYRGRALLIATSACPVHCRYCFRRHFPYASNTASRSDWEAALAALRRSPDVSEVILSGGDPLTLSNARLQGLVERLDGIESLDTLRIHTRFPVVLPERVDAGLREILRSTRLRVVVVVHANHANEIDGPVAAALSALKQDADALLNQSVLLAGVNDSAATLAALSRRLFAAGALPYYLHLLDKVTGTAHFEVPEPRALEIHETLRALLPGYLVPRLVRETPGAPAKEGVKSCTSTQ